MGYSAIIISVLALLVAAATSFFTYRQARSTRDQAEAALQQAKAATKALEIERERWRAERTPDLEGVISFVSPTGHRLQVSLKSGNPCTVLGMRFIESNEVEFVGVENGDEPYPALDLGKPIWGWVRVSDPYPRRARLEIMCRGAELEDTWTVPLDVSVFPELDERKPMFNIKLKQNYPPPHNLELKLNSPDALIFLEVTIGRGRGVGFLRPNGQPTATVTCGSLVQGEVMRWPIAVERERSSDIDLSIRCTGQMQERWHLSEGVRVPATLDRQGKPDFDIQIQKVGQECRLKLKLLSMWPLKSIEAEIDTNTHVKFIGAAGQGGTKARRESLGPGETVVWRIDLGKWMTQFFELHLVCIGSDEEDRWTLHETVHVPPKFRRLPDIPDD